MKPIVWQKSLFLEANTHFGGLCLRGRVQSVQSWLVHFLKLRHSQETPARPPFAITAGISEGTLIKPQPYDTLALLFSLKILFCIWSGHRLKSPSSQKQSACKLSEQGAAGTTGAGEPPYLGTLGWGVAAGGCVRCWLTTASEKSRTMKWIDLRNLFCMSSWIKYVAILVYLMLSVKTTDSRLWVRKIIPQGTRRFHFSELLNNGLKRWFITDHLKF